VNQRLIKYSFLVGLVLTVLGIFFFDQPIAAFVQRNGGRNSAVLQQGTHWLEIASGFPIGRYLLSWVLLGAAALLFIARSTRAAAWIFLFIACTQLATRVTAGVLKNLFHRLRPFEVIEAGNWDWKFLGDHGSSFPSGHSAHFWGLFFPLLYLFPRFRLPLLIIPVFISIARIGVNDHWCSDVIASAALAALITLLFIRLFRMQEPKAGHGRAATVDENNAA
jgi:membrane-associated phospholipid phosphatase